MKRRFRIFRGVEEVPPSCGTISISDAANPENNGEFRVEGVSDSTMLFVDATNGRIGIGTGAPNARPSIGTLLAPPDVGEVTITSIGLPQPAPEFMITDQQGNPAVVIQTAENEPDRFPGLRRIMARLRDGGAEIQVDGVEVRVSSTDWVIIDGSLEGFIQPEPIPTGEETLPRTRREVAEELAQTLASEGSVTRIIQLVRPGEDEDNIEEPIKLLEVNEDTLPAGIVPVRFGPSPPAMPFESVVVEVTASEYQQIVEGALNLPENWTIGVTLYPAEQQAVHALDDDCNGATDDGT